MSDWGQKYFEQGYAQRWGLPPITDQIRDEVDGLWKQLKLTRGSRVADIGCGPGRKALALAQRGAAVVGVDFAGALLTEAQRLGAQLNIHADWVRGDMRTLPLHSQSFDAAISMDAFGFFETEDENEAVLASVARILAPGGRLGMKLVNGTPILADFRGSDRAEREGTVVTISRTLTLNPSRMIEKISVTGSRGNGEYERRQRLYQPEEINKMFERAGLSIAGIFADAHGMQFEPETSKTMWIIGKLAGRKTGG
jgi:ubiquinone/menaquinone biosynthesis C-methylase UbiE